MFKTKAIKYFKDLLLANGAHIARHAPESSLENFFRRIKPLCTERELIRLGNLGDGGYLLPNDLEGVSACFSPGVSTEASFDFELAELGIPCYLADYSVDGPPFMHPQFHFIKRYLGAESDEIYITLESWVNMHEPHGEDFVLQMDIEGAEYAVILATPFEILKRFRILVIEFHQLQDLFSAAGIQLIDLTFRKLLLQFEIVHIHPNNCSAIVGYRNFLVPPTMEFTFLRKDRVRNARPAVSFPHQLDVKNVPYLPDIILPACWRHTEG